MGHLDFFRAPASVTLASLSAEYGASLPHGADASREFRLAWSLNRAGPGDVAFCVDPGELDDLIGTRAGACFVAPRDQANVPATTIALVTDDPLDAFRRIVAALQTDALISSTCGRMAVVHVEASMEPGVSIEAGAVIGPQVEIGAATRIGANSVIGAGVRIGRGCRVDSHASLQHALIGDRVSIGAGVRIGASPSDPDMSGKCLLPRLGRVIIQDDVVIGPNTVIDRGRMRDTMIGDRARIGALVFVEGGQTIDRFRVLRGPAFSPEREIG